MTGSDNARGNTALGPLEDFVGYHLRRASHLFGSDFARAVEGTGMRQVLFGILSVVSANPGINQGEVGRALGIKRANMVSLITELVGLGLIDRQADADDRRAFALTLTAQGTDMIVDCLQRLGSHEARLLSGFDSADRATLIALLRRLEALEACR
ncbi:MarR family winged helix-turn-helix transcriptional regulator [Sphingomonas sp.]|uniref:MarR family winged helix-turn-helix transcriptional regulator n=1 Tax=Sphingomonas sp. TaxID=28214 RepID=UPI003B3BAD4B